MNAHMSLTYLIAQATPLAKVVIALLVIASVFSWAVILGKRHMLSRARSRADRFEDRFWSGGSLNELYELLRKSRDNAGLVAIFKAGYEEYQRQQQGRRRSPDDLMPAVQRALRVAQVREIEQLEGGIAFLATVGSTSPYVGLFGTVWGIMNAFIAIGNVRQATIAMVAPGIAEALIATAMGLLAAIPAVIAYNYFTNRVERLEVRFNTFAEELIGILERGLHSSGAL